VTTRRLVPICALAALTVAACGSGSSAGAGGGASSSASAAPATVRLWLNGEDTPQAMIDYASAEFKKLHPGSTVVFERQQWTGIVEKLTTSLSSNDSPDVVELGNTQAQAFESAGALADLTAKKADLGGDDLVQSLVEAGSYDGKFYGAPYYGGARVVFYRKDLLAKAGLKVPTTTQEFVDAGIALKKANATVNGFSGIYFPGKYWYAALPFIWDNGGDIATKDGATWQGKLSSAGSVAGLEVVKKIMDQASGAPKDGDESKDYVAFCANQVGMLMGPGWKLGQITDPKDGCPALKSQIGVFALPGKTAGTTAPAFLGGSNLAVSAKSAHADLAYDLLKIMTSDGYQTQFAAKGLLPAKKSLLAKVTGDEAATAQAKAAANSRFVPSSDKWAAIEAGTVLPDMLVAIAKGGDVAAEAKKADEAVAAGLNG
jgi:N,N'-diacetylchitobiose transport system substrate-binding protein